MDGIKSYVLNICIASVLTAIFGIFLPKGSIKKAADIVMSLIVLSAIVVPALTRDNNRLSDVLDLNSFSVISQNEVTENNIETEAIKNALMSELQKNNIIVNNVKIETHKDEENFIIIDSVSIYITSERSDENIKNIIKTNIGIDIENINITR